ncbi:MAG: hypothetical protein JO015_04845 [Verrucomicrobia bacterium]|nr:hypothetical protein [Verrucomicrobiota bacterium]
MDNDPWPWVTLALLGAWHGLNPAMGWLFGVALGLQKRSRLAVLAALGPIALGHGLAIILAVLLVAAFGWAVPFNWVRGLAALTLAGFGLMRLWRNRPPKWVGMQVSFWDLTRWSALMSTAHGAGLMLVPVLLGFRSTFCRTGGLWAGPSGSFISSPGHAALAVAVHTAAHLLVCGAAAWCVYNFVGLSVLRRSWFNVDFVWSLSLLAAGILLALGHATS